MQIRNYKSLWVFGLAAALAGCGGGSNGPSAVTPTQAPPSLPAPPNIPQDPGTVSFDGSYRGFFAGVDQGGNVLTTNANSSALSGIFSTDLLATNASANGRVTATGTIATDGTVTSSGQGNAILPGAITLNGQVQPLGTGLVFMGSAVGRNSQNSQNTTSNKFSGRIVSIQDGTDNAYVGGYTGTLSGTGGNGSFNFVVANDGSVRGDVPSIDSFDTTFDGFSKPRIIGAVTRDGIVRLTGVSGQAPTTATDGSITEAMALYTDFQGQGTLTNGRAVITGFFTVGPAADAQTGTFTATRN